VQVSLPGIASFNVRAVRVPMTEPHATASGAITESPLVLTDVVTDAGVVGHSMVFTYTAAALKPTADLIRNFEPLVVREPLAPVAIEQKLTQRFRLLGTQGLVGIALAAIDMALWDALARLHGTSLVHLTGNVIKPVRAYGAIGYDGVEGSAKVAEMWAKRGFTGVKAKIGYPSVQQDLAVVRAIRQATGNAMAIMVDYNQCLTPAEAVQRIRVLDEEQLTWIEEPTLAHDYAGHAMVARAARTRSSAGEKLVGNSGHAARHRCAGFGFHDARGYENRRRDGLASSRSPGSRETHSRIEPSVAGNQRTAPVLYAYGTLARIRGLVEPDSCAAVTYRERHGGAERRRRHRRRLERRRGQAFCSVRRSSRRGDASVPRAVHFGIFVWVRRSRIVPRGIVDVSP